MAATPQTRPDTDPVDDFFLPDFCNLQAVLRLLLVSQLLALFLTMSDLKQLSPFPWSDFGLKSFLLAWVAMSSAGLFCTLRPQLRQLPRASAAFVIFFLFLALVAFFTFLAEGVLIFLNIHLPGQVDLMLTLTRNLVMGGVIAGLVLRYFFLQEQLLRRQRTELTARLQALQALDLAQDEVDLVAQVQSNVGGHLVVAAAAGVQLLAGDANAVGQARLDVHVHVFQVDAPLETAGLDLGQDLRQSRDNGVALGIRQHAHFRQHGRVRDRTADVLTVHALVKIDRRGEFGHKGVSRFAEAAAPH